MKPIPFLDTAPRDKLAHFCGGTILFTVLYLLFLTLPGSPLWASVISIAMVGMSAGVWELQPRRAMDFNDFLATVLGAVPPFMVSLCV